MSATQTFPQPQVFTLTRRELPDGCWDTFAEPVIRHAVRCATPREGFGAKARTLPRFLIKVDEETLSVGTVPALRKLLASVNPGAKCRVFRNAGFGATIDFENPVA